MTTKKEELIKNYELYNSRDDITHPSQDSQKLAFLVLDELEKHNCLTLGHGALMYPDGRDVWIYWSVEGLYLTITDNSILFEPLRKEALTFSVLEMDKLCEMVRLFFSKN